MLAAIGPDIGPRRASAARAFLAIVVFLGRRVRIGDVPSGRRGSAAGGQTIAAHLAIRSAMASAFCRLVPAARRISRASSVVMPCLPAK